MQERIKDLIYNWERRNIAGYYFDSRNEVHDMLIKLIPKSATVGFSGSQTLEQLEVIELLESRGNRVFDQYKSDLSVQESLEIRSQGAAADYYLASANAIAETGELIFFSAYGQRIAGIASAKNVVIIAGINKLTENLSAAFRRAREHATPLNCKRLNWDTPCLKDGICRNGLCLLPEYKRMCSQLLIIENEVSPDRLKVIIVNEELGF